ncbi:hypothetical protein HBZS_110710 [Helicobacter bizzozeronii CCUG 35545]|nr:hypothetical protein HBZS_110710 [Helicobacter bizzozeronii CCUG 35545]
MKFGIKVCLLVCLVGFLRAQDFVISYAMQVHNGIATNQSFGITRALKKYQGLEYRCEIPVDEPKLDSKQELLFVGYFVKNLPKCGVGLFV